MNCFCLHLSPSLHRHGVELAVNVIADNAAYALRLAMEEPEVKELLAQPECHIVIYAGSASVIPQNGGVLRVQKVGRK